MSPVVRMADRPARTGNTQSKTRRPASGSGERAPSWAKHGKRVPGAKKIQATLLPGFSRQLAAMLSAGMPIVAALEALQEQTNDQNFKHVIAEVQRSIENGSALSEALRHYPSIFDHLYANMVRGGESGGQLAETMARLATFLEASARLRRKVKSAMLYPSIVFTVAIVIAIGMIIFVVPVFGKMFEGLGGKLPAPTQFLLTLSHALQSYGLYIFLGLVGFIIIFKRWKATPQGAYTFDRMVLRAPIFGELSRKIASARFARTFGQLIRSGVPILSAMEIVAGATGNRVAERIVMTSRDSLEKGDPLSAAMTNQDVFPIMLVRMLQAGEKTGKVDEMMDSIADFYEDEVETMLAGLTSLLEPLLMIFLGVIIGGIVVSMFLPVFKIGEIVQMG